MGCAQVLDKFGDNGITGVYIVKKNETNWILDTFLLSCRVMGRGVEDAMLSHILKDAKNNGIKEFKAEFIPTSKNKPAENFLLEFGFKKQDKFWIYNLNNDINDINDRFFRKIKKIKLYNKDTEKVISPTKENNQLNFPCYIHFLLDYNLLDWSLGL